MRGQFVCSCLSRLSVQLFRMVGFSTCCAAVATSSSSSSSEALPTASALSTDPIHHHQQLSASGMEPEIVNLADDGDGSPRLHREQSRQMCNDAEVQEELAMLRAQLSSVQNENRMLHQLLKERQRELEESEGRWRHVADNAPVMIWMSGLDKLCVYFNKGWLDFRGKTLVEEYGYGWLTGVRPEQTERCAAIYVEAFDKREPFVMEYELMRHDGQYRWILDNGVKFDHPPFDFTSYFFLHLPSPPPHSSDHRVSKKKVVSASYILN